MELIRLGLAMSMVVPLACASEDEHDEGHEFESYDACVEHYESEGRTTDEIEELCADFDGGSDDS